MLNFKRVMVVRDLEGNDATEPYDVLHYECIEEACKHLGDSAVLDIINRESERRARMMMRAKMTWHLRSK